jgi:ATP-binding cassette subfamily C (CFTR/MRP) protein 1
VCLPSCAVVVRSPRRAAPAVIAYVPQSAWIRTASVRDNILFDNELSHSRYHAVLTATSLHDDLACMPRGDSTEVSSKSISGGQKQR